MSLATLRSGLGGWLWTVTGIPVYWRERSQMSHPGAWIHARLNSPRLAGQDSFDYRVDDDDLYPTAAGFRTITAEIRIYSLSFEDGEDALHYALLVQDAVALADTIWRASGFALNEILAVTMLDHRVLSREVSCVQIDLSLCVAAVTEAQTATTWVETVDMIGDLGDAGEISGEFP